jgi:predicted phosphatase
MSLFDMFKSSKGSTRELIGAASIEDRCLVSSSGSKAAFLIVAPVNLNVLSGTIIQSLVDNLAKAVKEIGTAEFLAINSAQSYDHNKHFLSQKLLQEKDENVKEIDRQDIEFLDDIQVRMATSREFLLKLSFLATENHQQIMTALERTRQTMAQNGFTVRPAEKRDIKRMLAIYFEQNIYEEEMQDFDGERYSPLLEVKR